MNNKVSRLRWTSVLETVSFLVLLFMMVTENDAGVSVVGAIHGLLFLVYAALVWFDHHDLGWSTTFAFISIITGPIGAIIVLERLRRGVAPIQSRS